MAEFLERFGEQLRVAQVAATTAPAVRTLPWWRRRGPLAGVLALLVAAPALAITQPWSPTLGRPGIDPPVTTDGSPVLAQAREVLAVLRRPQTAEEREQAAPLLRGIVGGQVQGVQTDAIRALRDGWALVPARRVRNGPSSTAPDQLCVTDGTTIGCGAARTVRTLGVGGVGASSTATTFNGLVPDGVARVRFTAAGGRETGGSDPPVSREAAVASNFYVLVVPQVAPPRTIDAPEGWEGPSRIPAPPTPVRGTITWLDAEGRVVGPRG